MQYVGYDVGGESTSNLYDIDGNVALNLTDDIILAQTEYAYDDAGLLLFVTARQRSAAAESDDYGPLDFSNSRSTYVGYWYDGLGRQTAVGDYGDNDDEELTPGERDVTAPLWNNGNGILVTRAEYNSENQVEWTYDALNRKSQTVYDDAGRVVKTVQNYVDDDPESGTADEDVTVLTTYTADGRISTYTAVNPETDDQVTQYAYGTTLADSGVARSDLLRAVIYPDSDDSFTMNGAVPTLSDGSDDIYDRVEYKYNNLGEQIQVKDQNQTVHDYVFDKLGRLTEDRATALGADIDGAVRRIERTYEVRGMTAHTTSYDNPTVGQGAVINDVFDEYNEWGKLVKEYQAHDGEVDADHDGTPDAGVPYVGYNYSGPDHGLRLESVRYPNGRILDYLYDSGIDDVVGRVSSLADSDETHLADYTYLGLDRILGVSYPEPGVTNDPILNGYDALDRFGRTAEVLWKSTASPFTPVADLKYGNDSVGNRTYRQDLTAESNSQHLDEVYAYDGVNQLLSSTRGHWEYGDPENDSFIADAAALSQSWDIDATGNWDSITTNNGTPQDRDYTLANELTTADDWVTSVYDQNGNMTTMPQPSDPTKAFHLAWDAWNRLVKVSETVDMEEQAVVEYAYDGANRRVLKTTYAEGELSETRHFYQSAKPGIGRAGGFARRCRPAIRLGPALYRRSRPPRSRQRPQRRPDRRLLWQGGFRPRPAPLCHPRRQLERGGRG